jgi:hypothetical protein
VRRRRDRLAEHGADRGGLERLGGLGDLRVAAGVAATAAGNSIAMAMAMATLTRADLETGWDTGIFLRVVADAEGFTVGPAGR